tara:strand:+ start:12311 stop:13633 length:1323 start_codon:yes stop_codon:yes gene_type:complete
MFIKSNAVDEVKSFYYQNVMSNLYISTTILSAIVLGLVAQEMYWVVVISSLFPFAYESISDHLKNHRLQYYYRVGLYLNSLVISLFIYSVSFEPSLSGLIVLMYTYTLISYGGWKLFLTLFPSLFLHLAMIYFIFGNKEVIHVPYELVASSLVASCCFIAVTASYKYESGVELLKSRRKLTSVLKQQSGLTKRLSRYLSPKLVESMLEGDSSVESHQRREVVTFFSDLCDFTSLSEELSPEDMSKILNEYLSEMSRIANEYGATIDKFIGDAVMVFFGAPNSLGPKQDAVKCLKMSLDMRDAMHSLNNKWRKSGISHSFKVRMGIHQGWATVGSFGATDLVNYTVIGTAVNVAARLEQNCTPSNILVSRKVVDLTDDIFEFEDNGELQLKGIEQPVHTYNLKGSHKYGSKKIRLVIDVNENTVDEVRWNLRKVGVVAKEE